jgi:hypothetical protein
MPNDPQFTLDKIFRDVLPRAEALLEAVSGYELLRAALDASSPWQAILPVRSQLSQVGLSLPPYPRLRPCHMIGVSLCGIGVSAGHGLPKAHEKAPA